jgi:hypothetical protein
MKDFFRLLSANIRKFSLQKTILFLEILFALMIAHICIGQTDNYLQLNKYYSHIKDMPIVRILDSYDTDTVVFCQENGTDLGTLECFHVLAPYDCEAYIYSEAMFEATGLKEHVQESSEDIFNSDADLIAVVPRAMSTRYKVGSDHDITLRLLEKRTDLSTLEQKPAVDLALHVKVYAVLDNDYIFTLRSSFEKQPNTIVLIDRAGSVEKNKIACGYYDNKAKDSYYLLNDTADSEEIRDLAGINNIFYSQLELSREDIFKPLLITVIIFVLFLTGFLGQHLLNLDTLRKNYAICFFCGATPKKAMALQFCTDLLQIAIPCLLSVAFMAYSQLFRKFNIRWDYSLLFCGLILFIFCSISLLEIQRIHRENPIDIIRKG